MYSRHNIAAWLCKWKGEGLHEVCVYVCVCERDMCVLCVCVCVCKNLPAKQEKLVQSLGWEDPLEKEMATPLQYSGLENPMDSGVWWVTVMGSQRVRHD